MLGVTFVVFTIMRMAPGDPVVSILGINISEEQYLAKQSELGLDQPFLIQFFTYVKNIVLRFDLGTSYADGRSVTTILLERFPTTLKLGLLGVSVPIFIGIPFGVLSATKQYSILDRIVTIGSLVFASMPDFWYGLMMMLLFSLTLGWLPASGIGGWQYWVMPVLAVGLSPVAGVTRMTRSSMLDVVRQDYIKTAQAKGLSDSTIIWKHALKNALIPVLTVVGMQLGSIMAGSVVIESIFSIPGMGSLLSAAINSQNYSLVQGGVIFIALFICLTNLLIDIAYAFVDPRIMAQYSSEKNKKKKTVGMVGGEQ